MDIKKEIWEKLKFYFDTDDGSLPEISVVCKNEEKLIDIFKYLVSKANGFSSDVTVWDDELNQNVPCSSYSTDDLYFKIKENSSQIPLTGIVINNSIIPNMGCFVFENELELDYRMGAEWNENTIMALVLLFKELKKKSPDINFVMPKNGEAPFCEDDIDKFNRIINSMLES